jgi:heme exporter protein D
MSAFFAMGGYAAFVWPAYAISIGVLTAMVVATLRAYRRARKKIEELARGT